MASSDQPQGRAPTGKWLVASLALNLFLAGLVVGSLMVWNWRPPGPPPRPPFQMMLHEASGKLSPEGLKKLSELADELETDFRKTMDGAEKQRATIRDALLREPFDPAAFAVALDDMFASFSQKRANTNRRFAEVIATLSPADRRQLATVRFP